MFVFAFSAGVPAFTQPEEVHESLSEGVAPLPKEGGGCKALQVGITDEWCETNYVGFPMFCNCDGAAARNESSSSAQLRSDAGAKPNILLVLTDDHGYTDLTGAIDKNVVTPWLGELRRSGATLSSGYATAPQCSPSRAGLLSGRNQNSFGLWRNGEDCGFGPSTLPPGVMTIAEHVKPLGYVTGMSGKWHLGSLTNPKMDPGARGFDWYYAGEINQYYGNYRAGKPGTEPRFHEADHRNRIGVTGDMAELFIDRNAEVPWFFYWAPYGPHHPMLEDDDPHLKDFSIEPYPFYTASENEARRKGLAMVKLIDMRFGGLVTKLRYHHLEESTLVIFSSDNGAPLGLHYDKESGLEMARGMETRMTPPRPMPRGEPYEDELKFVRDPDDSYVGSENVPLRGGKGGTWEGVVRVPMFVYWKGKIAPKTITRAVSTLDLTATIAHAAGMKERPKQHFDGVSLLPWLTDKPGQEKFPSHLFWFGTLGDVAVQSGNWKLRLSHNTFLFNITQDPMELYNLAKSHQVGGPQKVAELSIAAKAWVDSLPFKHPCGNGCSLEPIRKSTQLCLPRDYDGRFAAFAETQPDGLLQTPIAALKHMCWPAPLLGKLGE